ncbi:MAG TPA: ABC transporter permease, partial [Vicinamibacteria bacterium]
MTWLRRLAGAWGALRRGRRVDRELDDELHAYVESMADDRTRAGISREAALRAVQVEIGSLEAVKDAVRDVGWETRLESAWRDVRFGARALRKAPVFSAVAAATLALGIGANAAIFGAINAIMIRPLPVARPDELVSLAAVYPIGVEPVFSYAAYRRIAAEGQRWVDALAGSTVRRDAATIDGLPEPVDLQWVSGNYFTTLGVPAALGRTLLADDDRRPPGEGVAVISERYWTRRFGRSPAVVGRTFRLRSRSFAIVGVTPRGFTGDSAGESVDLWLPLSAQPGTPAWVWAGHSTTWLRIVARLRPGVTLADARAGLEPVYARIREEVAAGTDSAEFRAGVLGSGLAVSEASRGASRLRENLSAPLLVLMAIAGLVLLVACANVANLMVARSAARRHETAVCLAIGAGRMRLVRQRVAEALLLAVLGGLAGLCLSAWGGAVLRRLVAGALPISLDVGPDGRVLVFTGLVTGATAVLCGLLPALRATRVDPVGVLKSAGGPARAAAALPLGRTLVVAQIVVSLVLVVTAGLFVRSLVKLQRIDPGFDPDRVLLFRITPPSDERPLTADATRNLHRELVRRAASLPGV